MKHRAETRRQFLAEHRRALRMPSLFPYVDDGPITRRAIQELTARRTWDARELGCYADDSETRVLLCEARYQDWRRRRFRVFVGGKKR